MVINRHKEVIRINEVLNRNEFLESYLKDYQKEHFPDTPYSQFLHLDDFPDDIYSVADEYWNYKRLREAVEKACPMWTTHSELIREDYFDRYCEDRVLEQRRLVPYYIKFDVEASVANLKERYTPIVFDKMTYYCHK